MIERRPRLDLPGFADGDSPANPRRPTLAEWTALFSGAVRRRKLAAAAALLLGLTATAAFYETRTRMYRVETKILAQRQEVMPSIARPSGSEDTPTRSVWELVHRRENIINLIRQADLLPSTKATPQSKPTGWLGSLLARLQTAEDDPLEGLVLRLDHALLVTTEDATITISIDWPNPTEAYHLVQAAQQNLLEARELQEITAIDEVISLLQGRAQVLRGELDRVTAEVQHRIPRDLDLLPRTVAARTPAEDLIQLRSIVEAKERAVHDVEEFRRHRLAELQAQLDQTRAAYSDAYPGVISLRQDIEALSRESPQIAALRREEQKLRQDYAARARLEPAATSTSAAPLPIVLPRVLRTEAPLEQNERVRDARFRYEQMVERLNAAQVELDAARAGFKYRYNVIWPARPPRNPVSPKPLLVLGFGALASVFLALIAAAAPDVRKGTIVERWQIERLLELPVLGQFARK